MQTLQLVIIYELIDRKKERQIIKMERKKFLSGTCQEIACNYDISTKYLLFSFTTPFPKYSTFPLDCYFMTKSIVSGFYFKTKATDRVFNRVSFADPDIWQNLCLLVRALK